MASPITYINDFISNYKSNNLEINIEDFRKKLYQEYSVMSKYDETENLMLIYHKYELPTTNDLDQDCRSLVLDMSNLQVISYTCPNPIQNKEAQQFLLNNNDLILDMYKCYEGSILSLFHHNDKWFLTTRRCLDSKNSIWNGTNYRDMFMDVLNKENITFDEFTQKLDKDLGYHFILIHHKNKIIIDYTNQFGENYSKLCLVFVRSKLTQEEITNYELNPYANIFSPEKMSMEEFVTINETLTTNVETEGIIIKTQKNDKYYLIKLQTNSYQFCKAIGPSSNMFRGWLHLYQNGTLKNFVNSNKEHQNLCKIANPYNPTEYFDITGVADCVFKVLTSELFELYKKLWMLDTGKHNNLELYGILPKEYRDVLYVLRGISFKIKNDKRYLNIKDIYKYLKEIHVNQICALLRQRKLMNNWVTSNKTNELLQQFRTISSYCDKVHLKLIAIFTSNLFPDIMSTEIPQIGLQTVAPESVGEN